jgi:hypothetical protein
LRIYVSTRTEEERRCATSLKAIRIGEGSFYNTLKNMVRFRAELTIASSTAIGA